ncbi:extracellular solute-binding protein [Haladaptatus pallidirubidus]|uniref:extracellular solute-binding protein n=1 Tax=Haladaptatus pallidirubidus TaxID=1008152 RepID=UPI001D1162E3|nr:extracellular solute-binding protein [Haladaptatus pallidirubidus]
MTSKDPSDYSGDQIAFRTKSHTNRASRRAFLSAAGASGLAGLAGCTGFLPGGSSNSDSGPNKISVAAVEGSGRLFKRLVDKYVRDDTGVQVDVSLFPYANLFEKTSSVLTTQGDSFDLVFMDDPWFPQLAQHLEPIQQWLPEDIPKDKYIQTTLDIATWPAPKGPVVPSAQGMEEKLRGLVVVGNTQLFAYNAKYYKRVGEREPKTWDDVYRAGKKISEQIDGVNGYIIRGKRGNPINANFFGLGNSRVGDMFDKNWRYQWDGSKGVDTLDFYVNNLKSISPEGVSSFDSDRVLSSLSDGSAAQAPAWPSAASLLLDPEKAEEAKNIKFTPIPKGMRQAPQQGNWIAGINKYISDDKKKAVGKVIRSAVSKEAQAKYVGLGGVPFRHDTFKNNMDAQPWFNALYTSLQNAKWRPRTPLWNRIAVTQGKNLNSALTGDVSPKKALTSINDGVESILNDAGYYE